MLDLKRCVSEELSNIHMKLTNVHMEYLFAPPSDRKDEYVTALAEILREHATDLFFFACNQEMKGNLDLMEKARCEQWYREIRLLAAETIRDIGRPDLIGNAEEDKYDIVLEHSQEG